MKTGAFVFLDLALQCDHESPAFLAGTKSGMLAKWPHRRAQHRSPKRVSMISISIARKTESNGADGSRSWLQRGSRARGRGSTG